MILEAVFRKFLVKTFRKRTNSSLNLPENIRNSTRKSDNYILLSVFPRSRRFQRELDTSDHRIRSLECCLHVPLISSAFLWDVGHILRLELTIAHSIIMVQQSSKVGCTVDNLTATNYFNISYMSICSFYNAAYSVTLKS